MNFTKNMHKNSPILSSKFRSLCPQEFCLPFCKKALIQFNINICYIQSSHLMIFIKCFNHDGFWIVWSIAIMERTVLDSEVVLFLSSRYFLDNQNEQSRLQRNEGSIPSRQIRTQLGEILSAKAFFIDPSFSEILKFQIF